MLWLRQEGYRDAIKAHLQAAGRGLAGELPHLHVSTPLAEALLAAVTGFAKSAGAAKLLLKEQFPNVEKSEVSEEDFLYTLDQVLSLQSTAPGQRPLTLLVLDELEQYIGNSTEKMLKAGTLLRDIEAIIWRQ